MLLKVLEEANMQHFWLLEFCVFAKIVLRHWTENLYKKCITVLSHCWKSVLSVLHVFVYFDTCFVEMISEMVWLHHGRHST